MDQLIAELPEPAEAIEFRPQILVDDFSAYADDVLAGFSEFVEGQDGWSLTPHNYEGIHVSCDRGWVLLRKSLHDPQLPINIESDLKGGVEPLKEKVISFLSGFDGLRL